MDLNTLPGPQTCNSQHVPGISDIGAETMNHEQDPRIKPPWQKLVSSAGPMPTSSNDSESKTLIRQSTLDSDPSDSDSDSEEDSDDDDISNDEWSGANDNIEAVLYQAVYPNTDLAAHLIQTMYPMLVLSYTKKITRKVSSWQEKILLLAALMRELPVVPVLRKERRQKLPLAHLIRSAIDNLALLMIASTTMKTTMPTNSDAKDPRSNLTASQGFLNRDWPVHSGRKIL